MTQPYKEPYRQSLEPWAIYHILTAGRPRLIGRYRTRSDADGTAQWLTRNTQMNYTVIFETSPLTPPAHARPTNTAA